MTDYSGIIERLEGATAGRRLDCDIWRQVKEINIEDEFWETVVQTNCEGRGDIPHYTTSIDAALTLVPEGASWIINSTSRDGSVYVRCFPKMGFVKWAIESPFFSIKSPAIALCIAALRARSALAGEGERDA